MLVFSSLHFKVAKDMFLALTLFPGCTVVKMMMMPSSLNPCVTIKFGAKCGGNHEKIITYEIA